MPSEVTARDLRNHTREVLERVESGEPIQITVNRRPVAQLSPVSSRSRWVSGASMQALLDVAKADPGLLDDLRPLRDQVVEAP